MNNHSQYVQIRTKKIGLLLYDARLSALKTIEEVSSKTGIPAEQLTRFEKGQSSPSLPEIEVLAYFYDLPVEHFWGNQVVKKPTMEAEKFKQLLSLRRRLIGANIQKFRKEKAVTPDSLAEKTNLPSERLFQYEHGELAIPVPELEIIAKALNKQIDDFYDQQGLIGKWRLEQKEIEKIKSMPDDLREFVSKPINLPYLELAVRLSELDVNKLRMVAEGLLEITY
jgi:transcriptional regulator with XRE-family HTH domain